MGVSEVPKVLPEVQMLILQATEVPGSVTSNK